MFKNTINRISFLYWVTIFYCKNWFIKIKINFEKQLYLYKYEYESLKFNSEITYNKALIKYANDLVLFDLFGKIAITSQKIDVIKKIKIRFNKWYNRY
jgi:hypothetical protein